MQDYVINLEKILEIKNLPSWLYKCAFEIKVSDYLTVGDFFKRLDDEEVQHMKQYAEKVTSLNFRRDGSESNNNLEKLVILCLLLALGEGQGQTQPEEIHGLLENLFMIIVIEYLYRNKKVDVIYKNYSLLDSSRAVVKGKS